ncbi:MAG: ubiquinol-cytochrome c reductase iron-sulfur subunit [Candidatus Kapaibacterium sp.]
MFEHLPIKRRRVLRGFLLGGILAWAAPFVYAAGKFLSYQGVLGGTTIAKFPASELTIEHPSKLVEVEGEPVIVIREPGDQIRAFTATCTHLGCTVSYRPQMLIGQRAVPGFYCRCHGGEFDANGINVPGAPPKSPLTELAVVDTAGSLTISLTPKIQGT